jgi:hypothetical protein
VLLKFISSGKSIDLHFVGLSTILKPGEKVTLLFNDEMYGVSSNWIVDTYSIVCDSI